VNGLNDGLAYALEAQDFDNFQGMVNTALVPENRRGMMEHKCKLCQHQPGSSSRLRVATPSAGPMFCPTQRLFQPKPQVARQGYYTTQRQVNSTPIISRLLLLEIRVLRGLKLLRTPYGVNRGATLVGRNVTLPTIAPIHATTLLRLRGLKLLRTPYRVNGGATLVERKVTLPTIALIRATALLRQLCPPRANPWG
jgi:hypothetical protein